MKPGIQYNGEWFDLASEDEIGLIQGRIINSGLPAFAVVSKDGATLELMLNAGVPVVFRHAGVPTTK